jgi:hypothetical protein
MKTKLFALLTGLLALVLLEVGSFLLLSVERGEVVTFSALDRLRESRGDVAVVEIAKRAKDWRGHRIATQSSVLHPFLGYVSDPSFYEEKRRSWNLSERAMDFGFPLNLEDPFRQPSKQELVVAVFGGSMAGSFATSHLAVQETPRQFLRFAGRELVLLNLAMAGYKQPQQLMALNYFLSLGAQFDVVINLDGFNDVALAPVTNVPKGYASFYPRGWPLMVGDMDQELRRTAGELTYLRRLRAERAALFSRPPLALSMTASLVWTVLDRALGGRISRAELAMLNEKASPSAEYQAQGPRQEYASEDEMYDDLVALWKRSSRLMHGACRVHGVKYFHFLQPNQYLPGSNPHSTEERRQAYKADQPYRPVVEAVYPRLRAAGEELRLEGVEFVDLTEMFSEVEETLYIDTCCHVNTAGNALIAQRVVEAIGSSRRCDPDEPSPDQPLVECP